MESEHFTDSKRAFSKNEKATQMKVDEI